MKGPGEGVDKDDANLGISSGSGKKDDPFVLNGCSAHEAAQIKLNVLRDHARKNGLAFWRINGWKGQETVGGIDALAVQHVSFTATQIERTQWSIYFDDGAVSGAPIDPRSLTAWEADDRQISLPYALGWLHFDRWCDNAPNEAAMDCTIMYSGPAAKAAVYVYDRDAEEKSAQDELEEVAAVAIQPGMSAPWPDAHLGPFLVRFIRAGENLSLIGITQCGPWSMKLRLTHFDGPAIRELMAESIAALAQAIPGDPGSQLTGDV